jgi:kynurenine formamidase
VEEDFRTVGQRVRSWGRWGDDDERGTVNLLTADHVVAAAGLIRSGRVFELGIAIDADTPQPGGLRTRPMVLMAETGDSQDFPGGFHFADDYVFMALQAATQWDALAHVYYDEQLYNGFAASSVSPHGARHCGIDRLGPGPVGRGVLLDLPRSQGVDWLDTAAVVTPADLDGAAAHQGVEVRGGDILLLRTGWRHRFLTEGPVREVMTREPGLGMACADWLRHHQVAALGCDNWGVEVVPPEVRGTMLPLHLVLIRDLGLTIGEMFDLEALATDCAGDGRYDFFFCGQALKFTGGAGSPINPLAIK